MNSTILEALAAKAFDTIIRCRPAKVIMYDDAVALLTAEPEPCEDDDYGPVNLNDEEPDDLAFLHKPEQCEVVGCPDCDGKGERLEHDPSPYAHDEDGTCVGAHCPIPVQCETCRGTGKLATYASHRLQEMHAENERLREALEPFARIGEKIPENWSGKYPLKNQQVPGVGFRLATVDEYRSVAKALSTHPDKGDNEEQI